MQSDRIPKICVCGSINLDLVVSTRCLPRPGVTMIAHSLAEVSGGKGANQAVAAARLGAQVSMIGRVGSDGFAATLLSELKRNEIDVSKVSRTEGESGTAVVMVDDEGENAILVIPGANAQLSPSDIDACETVIASCDCLLLQLETPIDSVARAVKLARQNGKRVLLNPAPVPTEFDDRLWNVELLCPNQNEAEKLTGQTIVSVEDAKSAAHKLVARGPRSVIITLGSNGAVVCENGQCEWIPAFGIKAVDSTAAGDAFMGALAFQLCCAASLIDSVRFACAAGAIASTRHGAQPSLPLFDEVQSFLQTSETLPWR